MKRYFIAICLMLVPIYAQAKPLSYNKDEMICEANQHKKEAMRHLSLAENICVYIPDMKSREHMKALITSSIASLAITNAKDKFLAVGLGLIGSLATDMYDKYCLMREHLYMAAYHFEMANFYNSMSLHVPGYKKMDLGTREFFKAIDNLTVCEMLTNCIDDTALRNNISNHVIYERKNLLRKFNSERKVSYKIYEDTVMFYENIYEISAEVEDEDLRCEIGMHVYATVECVAASLRFFGGFDCWPDFADNWNILKLRSKLTNTSRGFL